MENPCRVCNGRGFVWDGQKAKRCWRCNGTGAMRPTRDGERDTRVEVRD